jgi:uncharacterized protein (TIGR00369 family)
MGLAPDLQAICDQSPIHRELGLRAERAPGGVIVRAEFTANSANGPDGVVVHGGLIAVLLDAAATFALIADTGCDWTTVDIRVDYLLPLAVGWVEATGEPVSVGRTLGRARAVLSGGDGRPAALAIATFRRGPQLLSPHES